MSPRKERIERMLKELRYEIERGIMENEIEEELHYNFAIPISRKITDGVVFFELRMLPMKRINALCQHIYNEPRIRLVKDEGS